jgi:nucleoside-diphosphate-sugar epimerase
MTLDGTIVAVSGSTGFLGQHLLPRLAGAGARVIEVSRRKGWDITKWESLKALPKFDVFIHLAAMSFVPESFAAPRDFYEVNVLGTANVLELCRLVQGRFIFASTYVYGNAVSLPISEKHATRPLNPYSESKVLAEGLCKAYARDFGMAATVLRVFNIYGPGQDRRFLIPTIIAQARAGKIELQTGTPKRDFIYVGDVADAYLRAVATTEPGCRIYNIGSGASVSVADVAEMIRRKTDPGASLTFRGGARQGEILDTVADIGRARAELGWEPHIGLEDGLDLCLTGRALDESARH